MDCSSFVSFAAKSSRFQLFFFITFQHILSTSIHEETDRSSFVSSAAQSTGFQLFSFITSWRSSWTFPQIPETFVLFSSSLVAGSLWNNVHTCCSCSNKRPFSILFCTSSWVVLGCYLCKNYSLHWLCPHPIPLSPLGFPLYLLEAIVYHSLSNSVYLLCTLTLYRLHLAHIQHLPFVHCSTFSSLGFPSLSCRGNFLSLVFLSLYLDHR